MKKLELSEFRAEQLCGPCQSIMSARTDAEEWRCE